MKKRVFGLLVFLVVYAGAGAGPALACGCNCSMLRVDDEFTCGEGLSCQYDQMTSVCAPGGCRDCLYACGSGMCNCGDLEYFSDCLINCGASPPPTGARSLEIDDPNLLRAQLAAPDCSGSFRLVKLSRRPRQQSTILNSNSLDDRLR